MHIGLGNQTGRLGARSGRATGGAAANNIQAVAASLTIMRLRPYFVGLFAFLIAVSAPIESARSFDLAPLTFVNANLATNFNNVRNGSGMGATAGGTAANLPDYWSGDFTDTSNGIAVTSGAQITVDGILGVSVRVQGTWTGTGQGRIQIVPEHFVEGAGQARIFGHYLKVTAGSTANVTIKTGCNAVDASNSYLSTPVLSTRTVTGTGQTFSSTYTTPASTGYIDNFIQFTYAASQAFDVTLFIGLVQDERGSTLHNLVTPGAQMVANDAFFARAIPESYFGGHAESPAAGGEPFPYINGPRYFYGRGKSFNPETRWNDTTNPSSGAYNFASIDAWVALMQSSGITPIWTAFTGDSKPTYVGGSATNPTLAQWQTWISALVTRYGATKQVRVWEGINEVDSATFYTGTKANAVAMQQYLYQTVKAADPTAIVLCPSLTGQTAGLSYMVGLLGLGVDSYCDAFPIHNYNQSAHHIPELNLANGVQHLWVLNTFAAQVLPVLDDESSYATNSNVPTNAGKMDFLAKQYILAWSAGHQSTYWYASDNTTYGTWWDSTNGYEDPATALKIIKTWLNGATMVGPVSVSGTVWTVSLTRPGGYTATVRWDTAGASSFTIPGSGVAQFRDLNGNMYTVTAGQSVPLTSSPLLFESANDLGQFITGYILAPAQSNKTIWDTARDGALPGGSYSSIALAYNTPYSVYQPESLAIFAAFTNAPSTTDKNIIDADIVCLKQSGVWSKLTSYQVYTMANSQAATVDWANVLRIAATVGTVTFTPYRGFAMTNITNYVNTNVNPTISAGTNGTAAVMTQNSNSGGYYDIGANRGMGSTYGISSGNGWTIAPGGAGTTSAAYRNWQATATSSTVARATSVGLTAMTRSSSVAAQLYRDGVAVATGIPAGSNAQQAIAIRVGGVIDTGTVTAAMQFAGAAMTATEQGNLFSCTRTMMTAFGVP